MKSMFKEPQEILISLRQPSEFTSVYSQGLLWACSKAQATVLAGGHRPLFFFPLEGSCQERIYLAEMGHLHTISLTLVFHYITL